MLMRGQIPNSENREQVQQTREMPRDTRSKQNYQESKEAYPGANANREAGNAASRAAQRPTAPIVNGPKIGRNDPCPCGSGKKFKNCHGRNL